ncbi:MAG: hypothetical protein IPL78_10955 [Chloroflexi bacterium]|nr:hypothetical protein [Chloroflexota bacterium]
MRRQSLGVLWFGKGDNAAAPIHQFYPLLLTPQPNRPFHLLKHLIQRTKRLIAIPGGVPPDINTPACGSSR